MRGVGNNGARVQGVNMLCVILTGCNTKCVLGSADEAGGVRYQTGSPMVRLGN